VKRKILDVGQCDADHSRISTMLNENFEVEIHRAHSHDEAIKLALDTSFDLIMINRLLDADSSPGMDVLNSLKSQPATADTPTMVISNFEDAQTAAVEAGAVPGFGKAALNSGETTTVLAKYLSA